MFRPGFGFGSCRHGNDMASTPEDEADGTSGSRDLSEFSVAGFTADGIPATLLEACLAAHRRSDGSSASGEGSDQEPEPEPEPELELQLSLLRALIQKAVDVAGGSEDSVEFETTRLECGSRLQPGLTFGELKQTNLGRTMVLASLRGYAMVRSSPHTTSPGIRVWPLNEPCTGGQPDRCDSCGGRFQRLRRRDVVPVATLAARQTLGARSRGGAPNAMRYHAIRRATLARV